MTRALIHVPTEAYEAHADRCMRYIEEHGYEFVGLIRDDWTKVKHMFDNDGASVAIVADVEHLDPNRKGRVEVVPDRPVPEKSTNERGDIPADPGPRSARNRRTQIIRRTAGE